MVDKKNLQNPLIWTAAVCAFLFYSGLYIPHSSDVFRSIISQSDIIRIKGTVVSNPIKNSDGKGAYKIRFRPDHVWGRNGISASAEGICDIYIASSFVESHFPGRLYTDYMVRKDQLPVIVDNGACFDLNVKYLPQGKNLYSDNGYALGWSNSLFGRLLHFRALCRLQFKRLMYAWGAAGGLVLALLSGSREYTEYDTSSAFQKAGLSYVLALSGMHLSLFSGLAFWGGNRIGSRIASYVLNFIAVVFFVWFAGFSPSLLRAFICSMILFCASAFGVPVSMITVLSLSFLIQSTIVPEDILQPAFMFSYAALSGILILGPIIHTALSVFLPDSLGSIVAASVSAQLFTVPIAIGFFHAVMPFGIIAAVIISPLIILFMYGALLFIPVSLCIPCLSGTAGLLMGICYDVIKRITVVFARIPAVTI